MLASLVIILFLAFLVTEGIVEYFLGQAFLRVPVLTPYGWLLMYVSAAVGIGLACYYQLDLVALLSQYLQMSPPILSGLIGEILTGLAVGRGANFVHDIISKFFPVKV